MQNLRKLSIPFLFFIFGFLLPSQLGKHFWPSFAFVNGVRTDYLAPTIYFTDLLLFALLIPRLFALRKLPTVPRKTLGFVIVCCIFFYFMAPVKLLFLYRIWQYAKIILAALVFYKSSKIERLWFVYGLIGSSLYTLFLASLQIFYQGSLQGAWWLVGERLFSISTPGISTITVAGQKLLRGYGTFSHPNSLAGFYLIVYVLGIISNIPLLAIPAIFLIFVSFSKTGVIMFAIMFLFFELQKYASCKWCRLTKFSFVLWIVLMSQFFKGSPGTVSERIIGWQHAFMSIVQNPFGLGLGNYLYQGQPVHNIALIFGMEFGLIGLICLIGLIRHISLIRLMRLKEFALIIVILSTGFVDHYWLTLQQNLLLVGVVIGLIAVRLNNSETARLA